MNERVEAILTQDATLIQDHVQLNYNRKTESGFDWRCFVGPPKQVCPPIETLKEGTKIIIFFENSKVVKVELASADKGIWIDGRASEEESKKLFSVIHDAIESVSQGKAFSYKDDKITVRAEPAKRGNVGVIFLRYGWNYPPKNLWVKEDRNAEEECAKCLPNGPNKPCDRETWCCKLSYNYDQCPYGVRTKHARLPDAM